MASITLGTTVNVVKQRYTNAMSWSHAIIEMSALRNLIIQNNHFVTSLDLLSDAPFFKSFTLNIMANVVILRTC